MPNRSSIEQDDITSHAINPDVGSQNPVPAEKLQKRAKKPTQKGLKTKSENAEDKAYILKLENDINLLKSTIELQNRQSRSTEHIENNRIHTNQTVNQPSHTDINNIQMNIDKQLTEQRLRMNRMSTYAKYDNEYYDLTPTDANKHASIAIDPSIHVYSIQPVSSMPMHSQINLKS